MPFTVTDCQVTTKSIELTFSDPLFKSSPSSTVTPLAGWWAVPVPATAKSKTQFDHSPLNPNNYTVSAPGSKDFDPPATIAACAALSGWNSGQPTGGHRKATASLDSTFTVLDDQVYWGHEFKEGDWVTVILKNIRAVSQGGDPPTMRIPSWS